MNVFVLEEEDMDRLTLLTNAVSSGDCVLTQQWDCLWPEANKIGREWFEKYWSETGTFQEQVTETGVRKIRDMSMIEEKAWNARALYDPNRNEILINRFRLEEMEMLLRETFVTRFKEQDIYHCLVAHEVFHHLEETKEEPVTTILERQMGIPDVSPVFRDVAAHAFANCICKASELKCQMLDIIWMEKFSKP